MTESDRETYILTDEEEAEAQWEIALDPDAPEWTDEDWGSGAARRRGCAAYRRGISARARQAEGSGQRKSHSPTRCGYPGALSP